jgi:hypothetical protein
MLGNERRRWLGELKFAAFEGSNVHVANASQMLANKINNSTKRRTLHSATTHKKH